MPKASKSGVRGLTREPGGRWSIDLRWVDRKTGRVMRHHERLPADVSANAAKKHARDLLNSALDGTLSEQKARKGSPERLDKALDEYLAWAETNRPKSVRARKSLAVALKKGLGDVELEQLSPIAVERYKRDRAKQSKAGAPKAAPGEAPATVGPATINREVAMLKHFAGLAAGWGWISSETAHAIHKVPMLKEPPGRVRYLSSDEESRLFAALTPTDGDKRQRTPTLLRIVQLADLTGMRRAEVARLRRDAVDLNHRVITLTKTKSNRVRRIPIADAALPILEMQLEEGKGRGPEGADLEYVFTTKKGKPYTLDAVTRGFHKAVEKAGIDNLRLHDIRHDFATKVRRGGAGIDVIASLLGHADITTSARYAHVEQHLLHAAVATLNAPRVAPPIPQIGRSSKEKTNKTSTKRTKKAVS